MLVAIKLFFFLVAVIDPLGSVPVFLEATKEFTDKEKKKVAIRASVVAFSILLFFIVLGQLIMDAMSISIFAFQISGGVILFLFALTMIFGDGKPKSEKDAIKDYKHVTVFPIAIPSIASPGAIVAVVLLTDNNMYSISEQVLTSGLVVLVVGITCLLLISARYVARKIGEYGITIVSKVMGLLLASFAVQGILTGLKGFFEIG